MPGQPFQPHRRRREDSNELEARLAHIETHLQRLQTGDLTARGVPQAEALRLPDSLLYLDEADSSVHGGDSTDPQITPTNISGSTAGLTFLGAWGAPDVSALTGTDAELYNTLSPGATDLVPVAGWAGSLRKLTVSVSADVGAAGSSVTVTVYKNGVALALLATLTGAAGTEQAATTDAAAGTYTVVATDLLTLEAKIAGTPAAVKLVARLYGS